MLKQNLAALATVVPPEMLVRAAVAAYNCGVGNVHKSIAEGKDPDYRTARGDYSRDVLRRMELLRAGGEA